MRAVVSEWCGICALVSKPAARDFRLAFLPLLALVTVGAPRCVSRSSHAGHRIGAAGCFPPSRRPWCECMLTHRCVIVSGSRRGSAARRRSPGHRATYGRAYATGRNDLGRAMARKMVRCTHAPTYASPRIIRYEGGAGWYLTGTHARIYTAHRFDVWQEQSATSCVRYVCHGIRIFRHTQGAADMSGHCPARYLSAPATHSCRFRRPQHR